MGLEEEAEHLDYIIIGCRTGKSSSLLLEIECLDPVSIESNASKSSLPLVAPGEALSKHKNMCS